jgi:hypothetical protein
MDAFQRANPDFILRLFWKTLGEIDEILGSDAQGPDVLSRSVRRIRANSPNDTYLRHQLGFYCDNVRATQILSDIVRAELLNEFGGIYLDCDTFPVAAFPDHLLRHRFFTTVHGAYGGSFVDNFFMGKAADGIDIPDPLNAKGGFLLRHAARGKTTARYLLNRRRFFKDGLRDGEYSFTREYIVDHYQNGGWKSPRTREDARRMEMIWRG